MWLKLGNPQILLVKLRDGAVERERSELKIYQVDYIVLFLLLVHSTSPSLRFVPVLSQPAQPFSTRQRHASH